MEQHWHRPIVSLPYCSNMQRNATKRTEMHQLAAMCSNVQCCATLCNICSFDDCPRKFRRESVTELTSAGMTNIKRTNTAELRRLFTSINLLLDEGYNHKQICAQLNSKGITIPYAQYRAIMTRLRRESEAAKILNTTMLQVTPEKKIQESLTIPKARSLKTVEDSNEIGKEKKFTWNPGSEIEKW